MLASGSVTSLQQKAALMGKKMSTQEATKQCSKKFPIKVNTKKVKK